MSPETLGNPVGGLQNPSTWTGSSPLCREVQFFTLISLQAEGLPGRLMDELQLKSMILC